MNLKILEVYIYLSESFTCRTVLVMQQSQLEWSYLIFVLCIQFVPVMDLEQWTISVALEVSVAVKATTWD